MSIRHCHLGVLVVCGLFLVALATGCTSEPPAATGAISVVVSPDTAVLVAAARHDFAATVANDPGRGVIWSIHECTATGLSCEQLLGECTGGPATCGTLTDVTPTKVTYTAPAPVPSLTHYAVTATSVADPMKSSFGTAVLVPIKIDLEPGSVTCAAVNGAQQRFAGAVWGDLTHGGATWGVTGCAGGPGGCGAVTDVTSAPAPPGYQQPATLIAATYAAPATVPPAAFGLTATSVADPTKSATATVAIYPAPTGDQIAFGSDRDGNGEIYVMNADGSGVVNLTNNWMTDEVGEVVGVQAAVEQTPVWSADGAKMAFNSSIDHITWTDLYVGVMGADCSVPVRLLLPEGLDGALPERSPAWSSDGTKIAFLLGGEIAVVSADGSSGTGFAIGGHSLTWSPGAKILFAGNADGNSEIYVVNADGSGLVNVTNSPAADDRPVWSPDGTKIAFHSNRDGNYEIYAMNADGSGPTRLTDDPGSDIGPVWSPDGSKIAFESDRDGNREIYVMNADGSGVRNLTNNPAVDQGAAWSPDGSKIAFTSLRDGNWEVYVMNADGSGARNLTNNPANDLQPAWRPR